MESDKPTIHPLAEIAATCRLLVRPPFVTILLLELLLATVSASIADTVGPPPMENGHLLTLSTFFFGIISLYLGIAATLAAGGNGEGSSEGWIRAAFRHRCFWRYIGSLLLSVLLILIGSLALVVGGLIVGSWVALSQAAVVLDRKRPVEAINKSSELTRPVRKPIGIIFTIFWVPALAATAIFVVWEIRIDFVPQVLVDSASTALGLAATIAFTRVYVKLGGTPTPPLQTLLSRPKEGSPA